MKIGIAGCAGRMGKTLVSIVQQDVDCTFSGGTERHGSNKIGDLVTDGFIITDDSEEMVRNSDAIIDFTTPESTLALAEITSKLRKIHIIGTTGLNDAETTQLKEYAKNTVIVHSHNMSLGVNLLTSLVEQAANILGTNYDIEVLEMHHKHKVDAPSGTAITLGEAAAKGRNVKMSDVAKLSREGNTGVRPEGEIGFATLRGGAVVGEHTVIFAGEGEHIELTHKAYDRSIFAQGAVVAAKWAKNKNSGFYSMKDVISVCSS